MARTIHLRPNAAKYIEDASYPFDVTNVVQSLKVETILV